MFDWKNLRHQTYRSRILVVMVLLCDGLLLTALSSVLSGQKQHLLQQEKHLKLASSLPHHWQTISKTLDASELLEQLSRHWRALMNNQQLQFSQVNRQQLKLKITAYDEQSFLQWIFAMQGQYAFKVEYMQMD